MAEMVFPIAVKYDPDEGIYIGKAKNCMIVEEHEDLDVLLLRNRIADMFADKFQTNTWMDLNLISSKYELEITAKKQMALSEFGDQEPISLQE